MDTSADIQFESAVDGSLIIITAASDTVTAPTITLDGEEVAVSKNGETKLDLKAGKHTIVKVLPILTCITLVLRCLAQTV